MTQTDENIYQLICTLEYFSGKSINELHTVEWLKNTSIDGISFWLQQGIKKELIYDKVRKQDGELIYYASSKGKRERDICGIY